MKTVVTIAGSDCSGGAGIQADIKTITAHKLYAMSAITSLTAQNTTGIYGIMDVTPEFLASELDCIFSDIFPDAVKIGMVSNPDLIDIIVQKLKKWNAKNIVVDPVMVSSSGTALLSKEAVEILTKKLFPIATLVTPNIPEAEGLTGISIASAKDMEKAAAHIANLGVNAVLVKGGHNKEGTSDVLYEQGNIFWYEGERIDNPNTHGTGCTLSSAIASNLAMGKTLSQSIEDAKKYLVGAIKDGMDLGKGSGPLNHMYSL